MLLKPPDKIRTLQRKLYAKAKQEPAYRFYALYDKIIREDILSHAWRLVRANRGSPGVDGISFAAIENNEFDSIPHAKLMAVVAERIVDGGILALINQWLKAPVIGEDDNGVKKSAGGGKANRKGTPQGGVISPLLANCYLHILDRIWQRRRLKRKLQAHFVRYADDFVVMCRRDVEEPLNVVRHVLERLGLNLNETKTHVVDATEASFNFLGFAIRMSRGIRTGKPYPHVCSAAKSLMEIKTKLTAMTGRELTPLPLETMIGNVNRSLNGWVNYFHYRNSNQVMEKVKTPAEQRLRKHLMKRHKVKDRGIGEGRFPSVDLNRRYGLYKVPTAAGWKSAHASA